jgi:hypothetical protein
MTWSIGTIRTAMATALNTVTVYGTTSTLRADGLLPDSVSPPQAVVFPADPAIEYDQVMGDPAQGTGADTLNFVVLVLVGKASERIAQEALDAYMDPTGASSVKAALEGTLGGAAVDCSVVSVGSPKQESYGTQEFAYLGIRFTVQVLV